MTFTDPILGGESVLVRQAIRSADYVPGVSGWSINRDGSAEFNDVTVRGELYVTDPDGSYVRIYDEDPGDGAVIEFGTADPGSAPGRIRTSTTGPTPALEIYGPHSGDITTRPGIQMYEGEPAENGTVIMTAGNGASLYLGPEVIKPDGNFGDGAAVLGHLQVTGAGALKFGVAGSLSRTNDTMTDIPGMDFVWDPESIWWVEVLLAYNAPTAVDAKFCWSVGGGAGLNIDRHILAPNLGTTTNIDTNVMMIRRANNTQQAVGAPNGVANAFTVYQEIAIIENTTSDPFNVAFQFAQAVTNATPAVLQGGYWRAQRMA